MGKGGLAMIVINEIQGSAGWLKARQGCFNASELSAAAGVSKYTSRAALLKQKATGIAPEVDDFKQTLFNKGHTAEASARVIAEEIVGADLSPTTGMVEIDGMKILASFDGITFDGEVVFEHKLWSDDLAAQVERGVLEPHYQLQIEQQMMVSGAKQCLFMTSDGTESKMKYCWIPAPESFDHILAIWRQFDIDLKNYVPAAVEVKPQAEAIKALPAVFVQATGMVTASNLTEFKEAATSFIAAIKTELVSDQDFADAESTVKFCKEAEINLDATKASVLAQMSTVDEVVRTLDHIKKQLADKRLTLDKLVKTEKESRKAAIVTKASADFAAHIELLEAETKPIRLGIIGRNFGDAVKGLKSLASMQEKVDTALRDEKFAADQTAKDVRAKLVWCKEHAAGQSALFPDLQALMAKPMEDFVLTITSRIEKQKADEAAKLEAQRESIRLEEERKATAKAQAEAEAILAAERAKQAEEEAKATAKVEAESRAKAEHEAAELEKQNREYLSNLADTALKNGGFQSVSESAAKNNTTQSEAIMHHWARPSDEVLITCIASEFGVPYLTALEWLSGVAERMRDAA